MKSSCIVVLALLLIPFTGCKPLSRTYSGLFRPKVDVQSSPELLMTAYKEYKTTGQAEKLWELYSEQLKAHTPNGLFMLEDALRREPIKEIGIGNPIAFSDGHVLYYNIVTPEQGELILERVALIKEDDKWYIDHLGQEKE